MGRITNQERRSITDKEVELKFHESLLKSENRVIAEVEKLALKMVPKWITEDLLNSGYLNKVNGFELSSEYNAEVVKACKWINMSTYLPVPSNHYQFKIKFNKKLSNLVKGFLDIKKNRDAFSRDLRNVLASFTTSEKLLKSVPELTKYFPGKDKEMVVIPTEQILKVRKALKLK